MQCILSNLNEHQALRLSRLTRESSLQLILQRRCDFHRNGHASDGFVVRRLKEGNRRLLAWAFGHHQLVLSTIAVAVAGHAATLLPRSFLPPFNEGALLLSLQYNPGIALAESHRLGLVAERLLSEVPEVKSVGRRTGRAELDEGGAFQRGRCRFSPLVAFQGGGLRRHSRTAVGCRPRSPLASRSAIASITCSRASARKSTTGLCDLLISAANGFVPLSALAEVVEADGPNQILRENTQRPIVVCGNGDGRRGMAAVATDIRRVLTEMNWSQGYTTHLEGTFQAQEEAALRIGALSLVSLSRLSTATSQGCWR